MKLGKLPAFHNPRLPKLAHYLKAGRLPEIPPLYAWEGISKIKEFGMMANDTHGDCVVAGAAHYIQLATALKGTAWRPTNEQIVELYFKLTGGSDSGLVEDTFLSYWQANGLWGHNLLGRVSINPQNLEEVHAAIYLFGAVMSGIELPAAAQHEPSVWRGPNDAVGANTPGSWGGHCTLWPGYGRAGFAQITWGKILWMDNAFAHQYTSELYALVLEDWVKNGKSPNGFAKDELLADLKMLN